MFSITFTMLTTLSNIEYISELLTLQWTTIDCNTIEALNYKDTTFRIKSEFMQSLETLLLFNINWNWTKTTRIAHHLKLKDLGFTRAWRAEVEVFKFINWINNIIYRQVRCLKKKVKNGTIKVFYFQKISWYRYNKNGILIQI